MSSFSFLFVVIQFRFDDDRCNELFLLCLDRTFKAVDTGGWTANFRFVGPLLHSELACVIVSPCLHQRAIELSMIRVFLFLAFSATGGSKEGGRDESPWLFDVSGARRW